MRYLKQFSDDRALYNLIEPFLPSNSVSSVSLYDVASKIINEYNIESKVRVLDLGCGEGKSRDFFQNLDRCCEWYGCDIESSPEVSRRFDHTNIVNFDGVNIPFNDGYFDYIHCNQVFEHVRYPEELLRSIKKVMKPNSHFALSVSHLEPYHSYSIFNYTPYGMFCLLKDAGFSIVSMIPGVDCYRLIKRRLDNRSDTLSAYSRKSSPISNLINKNLNQGIIKISQANYFKLLYSGQFMVVATKVD